MAGRKSAYLKSAPFNGRRLAAIIDTVEHGKDKDVPGIARGDSKTWRDLPDAILQTGGFLTFQHDGGAGWKTDARTHRP